MALKLYNSLSKKKEYLQFSKKKIGMYSCGPTVYDNPHIGNFRSFVFFDILKKYLKFLDFEVHHVMNVTDIDDKIIKKCSGSSKNLSIITKKYFNSFKTDAKKLRIDLPREIPLASQHISDMIDMIKKLIYNGYAYKTDDGSVFFKISAYKKYGELSKVDFSKLSKTFRVKNDEYAKEFINDFALWKSRKKEDGDIFWTSPWGEGRPGWHIECSAMSFKYLGSNFDIHCGGIDLLFPHHENEIAQSVCATNKPLAKFWIHCEHLLVDGSKMSKSLNNFHTLNDLTKKGFKSDVIRFFLISSGYNQKIDLTDSNLKASCNSLSRIQDFYERLNIISNGIIEDDKNKIINSPVVVDFKVAMNNNLNISKGLSVLYNWIKLCNIKIDNKKIKTSDASLALGIIKKIDEVLCLIKPIPIKLTLDDKKLIQERSIARENKNWKRADEIRLYFKEKGISLDDSDSGIIIKSNILKK